ncbi:hypothetical protein [Bacillus sp. AFS040349]|nr:hypothetical protein [Bacillus sp. AFS040349]
MKSPYLTRTQEVIAMSRLKRKVEAYKRIYSSNYDVKVSIKDLKALAIR